MKMAMKYSRIGFGSSATACLLVLSSCTVGPDYHKPATTMPSGWTRPAPGPATLPSMATTRPVELIAWWKSFGDPKLDRLVEEAINSNLGVQQAEARIRQARAQRGIDASAAWPDVTANGSYTRAHALTGTGKGANSNLYRAGFDASWEVDVFGGVRRNVEAADADIVATVEDRRDVLVTLLGDVAATYIDMRGLQERIDIARQNLATEQHSADLTRLKFEGGFVSGLDPANAQAQIASTRATIPVLESLVRQDIYTLSVLLGKEPGALVDELEVQKSIPTTPPEVPAGLPSELLRRRPDIRRAEAQLHATVARIGVATADLFPKFSLTGSAGLSANTLKGLSNWDNRSWSFGPSVSWDIFNAGRVDSNIQVQEALRDQSMLTYKQTVLIALKDVESSLVAYAKEQEHRAALADAVKANQHALDLANLLYTNGETDFLNVLTAQRSLLAAQDAYSQSTRTAATNLVSLYKATGGGWENNAYPTTRATTRPTK